MATLLRGTRLLLTIALLAAACAPETGAPLTTSPVSTSVAVTTTAPPAAIDVTKLRGADVTEQAGVASYRVRVTARDGYGEERFLAEFAADGRARHRIDFPDGRWLETTYVGGIAIWRSPDGTASYPDPDPSIPWSFFFASPSAFLMCCAAAAEPVGVEILGDRPATRYRIEGHSMTTGVVAGPTTFASVDADFWVDHAGYLARFDLTITGENDETWSESYEIFDVGADIVITDPTESHSA